jgi:hypothetical protein
VDAYARLSRPFARLLLVALAVAVGFVVAGCGSSSKPAYCDPVDSLKTSVSSLSTSEGISGLEKQIKQIASNAKTATSTAKSDFSSQTAAVETSVKKLQNDLAQAKSNPSTSTLAAAASGAGGVAASVKNLVSATKSKCS